MGNSKKKFSQLNVTAPISEKVSRFKLGVEKPPSFYNNLKNNPVFSFQSLSLVGEYLCYNNPKLDADDYHKILSKLKSIAEKTYEEMKQQNNFYKFHEVDFNDNNVSLNLLDFKKALFPNNYDKINDDQLPTCWQFEAYKEKRVLGYIGNHGVFYLVWFDVEHKVYPLK